ncbi:hypothetical protein SPRG_22176 [Saprolegnia parasitica CBS 223.65]|uniref:Transmembrane protein n=1 Tax=Saprolegnia parasitica (strain CBS 223.65) TaxID=695850 RepID=A0A067CI30_SAPPC|nr:hypothetical protein SPRG_22176 [Saprolegnia parasitica CBS 223.65]KDO28845.1 hypothetical protein SPRG_22176 [Saprolegnia parasitica CBS 223.65]|eukprot:XP_012200579.1 hypothetical protein SPRG_22176 [Saprolegnia parasitica CBS 223.65]
MRRLIGLLLACAVPIAGRFMPTASPMYVVRKPLQFMPHTAASSCALVNRCDQYRFMPRHTTKIQPRPTTQLPTVAPTTALPLVTPRHAQCNDNRAKSVAVDRPPCPVQWARHNGAAAAKCDAVSNAVVRESYAEPASASTSSPYDGANDRPSSGQSSSGPLPMQHDSSLSSGAIAGIAVGAAVCVIGAAALLVVWKKKRVNAAKHQQIIEDHTTGSGQYFALL